MTSVGAVLVGLSVDSIAASLGQLGHDGVVLGLLSMLLGQHAFGAQSTTAAMAVGALFLAGDRVSGHVQRGGKRAVALVAAATAASVYGGCLEVEVWVHAFAVVGVAACFRLMRGMTGWRAVFAVLGLVLGLALYGVVVAQSVDVHDREG
jgi:hypothetical protein